MNKSVKALITVLGLAALMGCQMNVVEDTPATVTGIEVTALPTTTTGYSVLSTAVDTAGMKISLVWSDGAKEDVTSYATVENIGTSADFQALTGEQVVTYPVGVLYTKDGKDYTAEFNITVQSVYDELRNNTLEENTFCFINFGGSEIPLYSTMENCSEKNLTVSELKTFLRTLKEYNKTADNKHPIQYAKGTKPEYCKEINTACVWRDVFGGFTLYIDLR